MAPNLATGLQKIKTAHQETLLSVDDEEEAEKDAERDDLERLLDDNPYLHEPGTKNFSLLVLIIFPFLMY